ncbi:Neurogenic_locus notch-like protein [Hexamita inflata]|uniref:Neurogenic locus notch-like protein n=1 Tax=Hexamita inflata TaxID=28002 RepID=A0AA86PTU1_9EUKA|nr:Neurogenic locus notch-like protein [Hexamita inflata]
MLFFQLAFQICIDKEHGITKSCNEHGKCENDVCVCETGYDMLAGPLCTVCATGYQLSTDSVNRCVNVAACMTNKVLGDVPECYGHGFCSTKDAYAAEPAWFCRCVGHFVNEQTIGKNLNCSACPRKYLITEDQKKCIPAECQSSSTKTSAVECGNYGRCLDISTGNAVIDIAIQEIEKLIEEYLHIEIPDPGCLCRTSHMNAMCTACDAGYNITAVDGNNKCYENQCFNYDEKHEPLSEECNGKTQDGALRGVCALDSFNKVYQCKCNGNFNKLTACKTCINHYSIESECRECEPGYDATTNCFQCTFGRSEADQCKSCLIGYDPAKDCKACLGGKDPLTRCTQCVAGQSEVDGKCVPANKAGSQTAIIVVCVILGIILVIGGIALALYLMRRKRAVVIDLDEEMAINNNEQ